MTLNKWHKDFSLNSSMSNLSTVTVVHGFKVFWGCSHFVSLLMSSLIASQGLSSLDPSILLASGVKNMA